MSETDANALGRWATLREAARILDIEPDKLLKQLKRGKRRGTQIGNNWFAYIDPQVEAAAQQAVAAPTMPKPDQSAELDALKEQNEALRDTVARLESDRTKPEPAALPAPPQGVDLAPLIDRIADLHQSSVAEIEFLRGELKSVREQHAEEMRRKDILLQQAHKSLQQAVRANLPAPPAVKRSSSSELERLRREQAKNAKLMQEMSSLMAVMYRRLKSV